MLKKILLPMLALGLLLSACNNAGSTGDQAAADQQDDMAQFADDQEFKDQHEKPEDLAFQGKGQMIKFATPDGKDGRAYVIATSEATNKYLFVIHEWWGLNNQIKREADELFDNLDNVTVMALDLYDGMVTDNPDKAGELMQSREKDRIEAIIQGAIGQAGASARIATIGWCFGGGWSLRSSILAGGQGAGCVMYYGMPVEKANELAPLKVDVLGIFAKQDAWINEDVVSKFETLAKATGKDLEVQWYDADHAFANPSNPKYDEAVAEQANALALAFLKERL